MSEENDKFDFTMKRIQNMDREELSDLLASVRFKLLSRVKRLSEEFRMLMEEQTKRDKIEERLEELGMKIKDQ